MNIASGNLYKAFGDKHAVFPAALDRYASERAPRVLDVAVKLVA